MNRYVTVGLLLLLVLYGLIEALPLIRGPRLWVESPTDYATSTDGAIHIAGSVKHVSVLTLNGAPLLYDQTGRFSSTLVFPRGGSILTFMAADRFGRTRTETRTIFVP